MNAIVARRRRRQRVEQIFHGLFLLAVLVAFFVLGILLFEVLQRGLPNLRWEFITNYASRRPAEAGILSPLVGSFFVIILTSAFALPVGIAAAVYLQFYAGNNWVNRLIQLNISNLAGVPSVVYGLFGLTVFVRFLGFDRSILSAGLTMGILVLPIVIVNTQEALKAVPPSLAQGAYALGASRWQVIWTVVLPAAIGGILTGSILSVSRGLGETAPMIMIGAWTFMNYLPKSIFDSFTVLPVQIWTWSSRPQEAFREIAGTAIIVLLVVLLTINGVAIYLRNRYQKKAEW